MMKGMTLADVCDVYGKAGVDVQKALATALLDYAAEHGLALKKSNVAESRDFFCPRWGHYKTPTATNRRKPNVRAAHR